MLIDCEAAAAEALARRLDPVPPAPPDHDRTRRGRRCIGRSKPRPRAPDPRLPALGERWLGMPAEPATGWLAHRLSLGVTEGVAELGEDETLWLEGNAPS